MCSRVKYTLNSIISTPLMSLVLLYLGILQSGCSWLNLAPYCHVSLPNKPLNIQNTSSCASCHHCKYSIVSHGYTNTLSSHVHVNTTYFLNVMYTLVLTSVILQSLDCTSNVYNENFQKSIVRIVALDMINVE